MIRILFIFILTATVSADVFSLDKTQQAYFDDVSKRKSLPRDLHERAMSYESSGHLRKACVYYLRALSGCDDMVLADTIRMRLIGIYLNGPEKNKALFHIEHLESPQLKILARGRYHFAVKDHLRAFNNFNLYVTSFSSDDCSDIYFNMARALFAIGRINDACYAYLMAAHDAKANGHESMIYEALYGAGVCWLCRDDQFKAEELFLQVIDKALDKGLVSDALSRLGPLYLERASKLNDLKKWGGAAGYFSYLYDHDFSTGPWCLDYAQSLEKTGDIAKARSVYEKVIARADSDTMFAAATLRLAKIAEDLKDIDYARKLYSSLLSRSCPETKIAREKLDDLKFK